MTYIVQTLPHSGAIILKVTAPVIAGEVTRIYHALQSKLSRRAENSMIHVIFDLTAFTEQDRFPIERYVLVLSKTYEQWYYQRTLSLWLGVDSSYEGVARYLAQTWCLPVYLHTNVESIFKGIAVMYGDTDILVGEDTQD
ncbi:MAG: hypothetical protein ACFE0Q_12115 [Anaerolineae bacterium]